MAEKEEKVKKGPGRPEFPVKLSLLSAEEKAALTKEAEQAVIDQRKSQASTAYFDQELERLRQEQIPAAQMVNIVIDSAPYILDFRLDGQVFMNGYEYQVPLPQALVLQEQMQRSWAHQDEIDGRSRSSSLRRVRDMQINPRHAGTVTRGFDRGKIVTASSLTEDHAI